MKVLIIEDRKDEADALSEWIKNEVEEFRCVVHYDFKSAEERIKKSKPDIVVLDLFRGVLPTNDSPGVGVGDFIWRHWFCPVVVHSADPSRYDERQAEHPFVECVRKRDGSLVEVVEALKRLHFRVKELDKTITLAKRRVQRESSKDMRVAMRHVARHALFPGVLPDEKQRAEVVERVVRRRLAAMLDEPVGGVEPKHWEMYLCPPIGDDPRLGDVLGRSGWTSEREHPAPENFLVVVTPSCDLDTTGGRPAKVEYVLVAQCVHTNAGLKRVGLESAKPNKLRERLPEALLNSGHSDGIVPLPKYLGVVPSMAADLRKLQLIKLCDIGDDGEFERVASMDSPFRELISWAYIQVAGRIGLPNRDIKAWVEEIIEAAGESSGKAE